MPRTKLKRFSKLNELTNVFNIKSMDVKESIYNYFKDEKLFTIEIGCGQGDYTVELARKYPARYFVGIDVKGARVYHGALKSAELKIKNVAFVLARAERLNEIFLPKSVEKIYIPFPDPHIRRTSEHKRLVSASFLKIYKELLIDTGVVHFKTDNKGLYDYTLNIISELSGKIHYSTEDFYEDTDFNSDKSVITTFEKHYINDGRQIKYICFRF